MSYTPALTVVGDADPHEALLDRVFFALADPVRRAILQRLKGESLLVSELAAPFDISIQAVSRHIQVLVRAGLVRQERTGRISRCNLEVGAIFAAAVWINGYSQYWQHQFDTLAAWLETLERKGAARRDALSEANRTAAAPDLAAPRTDPNEKGASNDEVQ